MTQEYKPHPTLVAAVHKVLRDNAAHHKLYAKAITSVALCGMGAYCMWLTNGETGIGWAILGLMIIW